MFKKANKEIARFVDSCSCPMPTDSLGEVSCFRGMMGTNYNYVSQARTCSHCKPGYRIECFLMTCSTNVKLTGPRKIFSKEQASRLLWTPVRPHFCYYFLNIEEIILDSRIHFKILNQCV